MMNNVGIDYGLRRSNIDTATGIRYGVIGCSSINQDVLSEDFEAEYGEPHCPKCGNDPFPFDGVETDTSTFERQPGTHNEYVCVPCAYVFDGQEAFPDEAQDYSYKHGDYQITSCFDLTELFVIRSPYYTFTQYCSPCAPGAGNLDRPMAEGVKTYCLGHDFFDGGKAPYPVYRVLNESEVSVGA